MTCVCDGERPDFYCAQTRKARRSHVCEECGATIRKGETYEHVSGRWDGEISRFKTCARCVDLRQYVKANIPCFCWEHGNMLEQAEGYVRYWAHETSGLFMGWGRRCLPIRRRARNDKAARWAEKVSRETVARG